MLDEIIKQDWEDAKQELNESNLNDLQAHFGKDTYGSHELCDRVHLFLSILDEYILSHPSCILNEFLYEKAHEVFDLMSNLYNMVVENDMPTQEEFEESDLMSNLYNMPTQGESEESDFILYEEVDATQIASGESEE